VFRRPHLRTGYREGCTFPTIVPRRRPQDCRAGGGGVRGRDRRIPRGGSIPRRVFQRLLPEQPTPERCVEAYYLQRTRFESIAERKIRRRQLTEDGMWRSAGGTRAKCR